MYVVWAPQRNEPYIERDVSFQEISNLLNAQEVSYTWQFQQSGLFSYWSYHYSNMTHLSYWLATEQDESDAKR